MRQKCELENRRRMKRTNKKNLGANDEKEFVIYLRVVYLFVELPDTFTYDLITPLICFLCLNLTVD